MSEDTPELDELPVEALPEQEAHFRAPARFGNVPVAATPLGWDARNPGFRNHYPVVNLPTQICRPNGPSAHPSWSPITGIRER